MEPNGKIGSQVQRRILPCIVSLLFTFLVAIETAHAQCPPVITPLPGPGVLINGSICRFCSGDSVLLSASPSGTTGYEWRVNGTLIIDSVRSILTVKAAGVYTVKAPGCPTLSSGITIVINPLPTAYITSDPIPPICSGDPITLTLHTNASEFYWLPPVPTTAMYSNPITLLLSGSTTAKAVTLNNSNPQCSKVATYYIQVNFPISGGWITDHDTICSGETPAPIVNTGLPSGGNGTYEYFWVQSVVSESGPWTTIPGTNNLLDYSPGALTQTTWFARVAKSPPCAQGITNSVVVVVNEQPEITSVSKDTLCSGETFSYLPTSNLPDVTYSWTASSATVTGFSPSGSGSISDILSLPPGSTMSGNVIYTITPVGPEPTLCAGDPFELTVTVNPIPEVTNASLSQTICAGGTTTAVTLTSGVPGTTFTWTASVPSGISMSPWYGNGNIPAITIYSTNTDPVDVPISIVPEGPDPTQCTGSAVNYIITVNPSPTVTNSPLSQALCSGETTTEVILTSNVSGTTFTWTATADPPEITGYLTSGTSTLPAQTLINPTTQNGTVTYHILPSGNLGACPASPRDYVITVGAIPAITSSLSEDICSGQVFSYALTSNVINSGFSWTRPAVAGISPGAASGTNPMISETLTNLTASSLDVVYHLTPTSPLPLQCEGNTSQLVLTVRPLPVVFAGNDQNIPFGTSTSLSGSSTGETLPLNPSWQPWTNIDPPSSSNQLSVQTSNLYSNTEFTLTITDGAGCQNSDAVWVYLTGSALAANPTADQNPVCYGSTTTLHANATGGSENYDYTWSPASGLSDPTSANPVVTGVMTTTYTVTIDDGYNQVSAPVTLNVTPIPTAYTVGGGGAYCQGGNGVTVTLGQSTPGVEYTLMHNGNPVSGSTTFGTGSGLSWNNQTLPGTYTVGAQQSGCPATMTGQAVVSILPLPTAYTVTGGGSYPAGGSGVPIGLSGSQTGYEYYLELQGYGVVPPSPVTGTGSAITFGNQTIAGTYIVRGMNPGSQCETLMSGNATIGVNPAPTVFDMTGGGEGCENTPGVMVGLSGSEAGIQYILYKDGAPEGSVLSGTGSALSFGLMQEGSYTCIAQNPVKIGRASCRERV